MNATRVAEIQAELRYEPLSRGGEDVAYAFDEGHKFALSAAAAVAIKWRDENKASAAKARKSLSEGSRNMAEMLDGAAIECNAIAAEILKLSDASTPRDDRDIGGGL